MLDSLDPFAGVDPGAGAGAGRDTPSFNICKQRYHCRELASYYGSLQRKGNLQLLAWSFLPNHQAGIKMTVLLTICIVDALGIVTILRTSFHQTPGRAYNRAHACSAQACRWAYDHGTMNET